MSKTQISSLYKDYQKQAVTTKIYKDEIGLPYVFLGLIGELGELREKSCFFVGQRAFDKEIRLDISAEGGDVCWYVAAACEELQFDADTVFLNYGEISQPQIVGHMAHFEESKLIHPLNYSMTQASNCAEVVKKYLRDDYPNPICDEKKEKIKKHLQGLIVGLMQFLVIDNGFSMELLLKQNVDKLQSRKDRGVLKGSGDNR